MRYIAGLLVLVSLVVFGSRSACAAEETVPEVTDAIEKTLPTAPPNPLVEVVRLTGTISDSSIVAVVGKLSEASAAKKGLIIAIDSGGGSVDAGVALVQAIERSGVSVTCIVDWEAYSMAFYILQGCNKRVMTQRSILMAHEPKLTIGSATLVELEEATNHTKAMMKAMANFEARRLTLSVKQFMAKTRTNWWMSAEEALEVKAVDEVVDSEQDFVKAEKLRLAPASGIGPL